ncbi:MAG: phage portal protein [Planctomycetota bacterium]|jgi:hypothetical protein
MGFDFHLFGDDNLSEAFVDWLVDEQWVDINTHFVRLWEYYQNQMYKSGTVLGLDGRVNESGRNYIQGQESGLPSRITGVVYSGSVGAAAGRAVRDIKRKEVVIENDISWRINAMVDFLFGKQVDFVSKAPEARKRREIEKILRAVFEADAQAGFFQNMAVLGSVYGFVDCIVRPGEEFFIGSKGRGVGAADSKQTSGTSDSSFQKPGKSLGSILQSASHICLELIEAPRALPILDENDYRKINYYVQNFYQRQNSVNTKGGFLSRLFGGDGVGDKRRKVMVTEVIGPRFWQRYEDKELVWEGENILGMVPVVHVQNVAQPYYYEGISDVDQLIGLQDELNTRLSDRANRITFQSFKMYLAKGVEGFEDKPVSPGRMWCTDNIDASIEQFGGDSSAPSEDSHITEIREAMDKVSGVTPVVAGILKNKLGNLTSGVALKMTFMGMLARAARKQFTYGQGLRQICEMILHLLDVCDVYHTEAEDRKIEVLFPNPLPENTMEKLQEAQIKKDLGVPREQVLRELGYEMVSELDAAE